MAPRGAPDTALAMAWRMAQVVKTLVDRPMHVATVNGLKRKLHSQRGRLDGVGTGTYTAAMMKPLQRFSRRGDVNRAEDPASPESAIFHRAPALSRSTAM